ncbi:MotA/TolQ/ExbB proton channel family protein [Pleionea litopenaei]|uniref:MotA/TolQ/ExbB proton channel family protein n=1 Tax=Pleionea litopenaei TaxID=3070815 RepID=A0AA51X6A5_9GAMM|nr:MotA/TolQ/ExbB proton channel family protein [Pleionea sp. HL-JVS1]WMS86621.1 MotA/TolQ/ExbB proton channel family protein [Pleionea sp. HL-JVS1]
MKLFKLLAVSILASNSLFADDAINLDSLLKKLEQGSYKQSQENKAREAEFINKRSQQDALLQQAVQQRDAELKISEEQETVFEKNEAELANLNDALDKRMGSLKELFGVLQQVAGDTTSKFDTSLVSIQYPNRGDFLTSLAKKMGSSSQLASIEEIEQVWFELQREIIETGKVSTFETEVISAEGPKVIKPITRIGAFNIVADGKYLEYTDTGAVAEMIRQPSSRYTATISDLESTNNGWAPIAIDPTGGSILGLLVQAPDIQEKIDQGGIPGYIIIAVGIIAFLISLERFFALFITERKVRAQLKSKALSDKNPLGRILQVKEKYPNVAIDTLELKLSEAILKELPSITRSITFVKIISVVAPLLGLLGTVTGMIQTFEMITLFGAGDPKLMANGISQALVTTVLGLVVAIPTVLLYTWLNTRSKNIVHILQEQSAGIIAERAEQGA